MPDIPELATPRLRLRAHAASDHSAATRLWQSEAVYRFITGEPLSEQEVWMRLLRYSGLWDFLGYGYWAVEERESRRYIGQLGFADFRRGLVGFDGHFPEAGWVLHPEFAGRGYAREAMAAACAWLDEQPAWDKSFCVIAPDNTRSLRLAEKLGYRFVLDTYFGEKPTGVFFREQGATADAPGTRPYPGG